MNRKNLLIGLGLFLIIGFNYFLYKPEFSAVVDVNDNSFQYALVDEAKNIWNQVLNGKLSPIYLLDSWNERWSSGFALTNYYAHLPQAIIGLLGGYNFFVIVKTWMLILMPLMFFWGGAILGLPAVANLILALLSQTILTDGLYGLDATSYVWRGWGLSAQLMAQFFLPLGFAYALDYIENKKNLIKAVIFNFLIAQSHIGIFLLLLLGYPLYWLVSVFQDLAFKSQGETANALRFKQVKQSIEENRDIFFRISLFVGLTLFSLAYFILPIFLQADYRNFSVWDPIWKFDSWGLKQILIWLLNGDLFDFNRLPVITYLVVFGLFFGATRLFEARGISPLVKKTNKLVFYFSLLFVFYFSLFLGKSTFGNLINIIPGFSEYHQHRIVLMVQFAGIFVAGCLVLGIASKIQLIINFLKAKNKSIQLFFPLLIAVLLILVLILEKPIMSHAKDNEVIIKNSVHSYLEELQDFELVYTKLASLPKARAYVGRPGNWGKDFKVGPAPVYFMMSVRGYPTVGYLPESWSMNSDAEQFFAENNQNYYELYNVKYSILPNTVKAPEFSKLLTTAGKFNLYSIETGGWFTTGKSNMLVRAKKTEQLKDYK